MITTKAKNLEEGDLFRCGCRRESCYKIVRICTGDSDSGRTAKNYSGEDTSSFSLEELVRKLEDWEIIKMRLSQ